jgi:hypothetical protein
MIREVRASYGGRSSCLSRSGNWCPLLLFLFFFFFLLLFLFLFFLFLFLSFILLLLLHLFLFFLFIIVIGSTRLWDQVLGLVYLLLLLILIIRNQRLGCWLLDRHLVVIDIFILILIIAIVFGLLASFGGYERGEAALF